LLLLNGNYEHDPRLSDLQFVLAEKWATWLSICLLSEDSRQETLENLPSFLEYLDSERRQISVDLDGVYSDLINQEQQLREELKKPLYQ
jgi:hypothetical protein